MRAHPKSLLSLLAAALGAAALPTLAADVVEVYTPPLTYYYAPATTTYYYVEPAPRTYYYEPAPTYYYDPAPTYYVAPAPTVYAEPPVVVEAPRYYNDDVRITDDVVATIASDSRISGKIGVSTFRNQVELTGRVGTPNQAELAARDAKSVPGVDDVTNRLRARVGG